jgi:hypothetical protein
MGAREREREREKIINGIFISIHPSIITSCSNPYSLFAAGFSFSFKLMYNVLDCRWWVVQQKKRGLQKLSWVVDV